MVYLLSNINTIYLVLSLGFWNFPLFGGRGGTGVWIQDFMFTKQVVWRLSHTSSPFCLGYFGGGSLVNYLSSLALSCDLSYLSFLSS
jgi:hypothetical protein